MIELYELRQFVTFAETGTLSDAANVLHLSQPALSRNMKKLEDELGVTLFLRRKNKLELNENGKYILELSRQILEEADSLVAKARIFDRQHRTISLGVCSRAPIWFLTPLISNLFPHMALQTETDNIARLLSDLENNVYQLVVVPEKPEGSQYFWKKCGQESLLFFLPENHRYARRQSLAFADMDGENMLLMSNIGFWNFVCTEKMKKSKFLVQKDRFSLNELLHASTLPSFTSDLAHKYFGTVEGRVEVPITDADATVTYYLVCLAEKKKEFMPLFDTL